MQFTKNSIAEIQMTQTVWNGILDHCHRKLARNYLPGENEDLKAFGLLGGKLQEKILTITTLAPLFNNARSLQEHRPYMDEMMSKHAIQSETPLHQRGWVADPQELQNVLVKFRNKNSQLVGSYHMHRVAWDHDKERDTPTELDTILGINCRMFMFIIAMVNPEKPKIRAFFEGNGDLEVPVNVVEV